MTLTQAHITASPEAVRKLYLDLMKQSLTYSIYQIPNHARLQSSDFSFKAPKS